MRAREGQLLLGAIVALWGCDGGGVSNPTPHPGPAATVFDDYVITDGNRADEGDPTQPTAGGAIDPTDDGDGFANVPEPGKEAVACQLLSETPGLELRCASVCKTLTGCAMDDDGDGCEAACRDSVAGFEQSSADAVLSCFDDNTCGALERWSMATDDGTDTAGVRACLQGFVDGWAAQTLSGERARFCEGATASAARCDAGTAATSDRAAPAPGAADTAASTGCTAVATALTVEALDVYGACDPLACADRDTCRAAQGVCTPLFATLTQRLVGLSW